MEHITTGTAPITTTADPPTAPLPPIPFEELSQFYIWVNWKSEKVDGRDSKIPYSPKGDYKAATDKPDTWTNCEKALIAAKKYNRDGVGLCLPEGYNLVAVDIDGHQDGKPSIVGAKLLELFKARTYVEVSPSGTGYHAFCLADPAQLPFKDAADYKARFYQKNSKDEIEIYLSGLTNRYMTYTGKCISEITAFTDCTDLIKAALLNHMTKASKAPATATTTQNTLMVPHLVTDSTTEILDRMRKAQNGAKFTALYDNGDLSYNNNDHSSADLALCEMLAFAFNGDPSAIDYAFRGSALFREKWDRDDYRNDTISKAVNLWRSSAASNFKTDPRTDRRHNNPGRPVSDRPELTAEFFSEFVKEQGISIRENTVLRIYDIAGLDKKYNPEKQLNNLVTVLYSKLKTVCKGVNPNYVQQLIELESGINRYNPVADILSKAAPWDGIDRLPELYNFMKIPPEDKLSKTLVHKFLLQALVICLYNDLSDPIPPEGVLTLVGPQGVGKSTLVSVLAIKSEFCKLGLNIDPQDKDSLMTATAGFINELGELETTLKRDISALKAFISKHTDEYRAPYARGNTTAARRTSFIATCNSDDFLIDTTGNRRFWTVPINNRLDVPMLLKYDVLPLWKQIQAEIAKEGLTCFRLTVEELELLAARNGEHTKLIRAQAEVKDILETAVQDQSNYHWKHINPTEFKTYYSSLARYTAEDIGKALKAEGIVKTAKKINGKSVRGMLLPIPGYGSNDM